MSDMIERVSKAIASGLGYDWNTLYAGKSEWNADRGSRHDINVPYKPDFIEAARAAIEAMMEPTASMSKAGDIPGWDDVVTVGHGVAVWQAMILDALGPSDPATDRSKI